MQRKGNKIKPNSAQVDMRLQDLSCKEQLESEKKIRQTNRKDVKSKSQKCKGKFSSTTQTDGSVVHAECVVEGN